eukprot:jgi/Tetstr1/440973/TSEL_029241.t1
MRPGALRLAPAGLGVTDRCSRWQKRGLSTSWAAQVEVSLGHGSPEEKPSFPQDALSPSPWLLLQQVDDCVAEAGARDITNTLPLSLYITVAVPTEKVTQFEQWIQQMVVVQSQSRQGYQGTVFYRSKDAAADAAGSQVFVVDIKYAGVQNLQGWLCSPLRASLLARAQKQGLWVPGTASSSAAIGRVTTINSVWLDAKREAKSGPVLSKWKLVMFNSVCIWLTALALAWPQGSPAALLKYWGMHAATAHAVTTACITFVGVFVTIPYLQQYFKFLLLSTPAPSPSTTAKQPTAPPASSGAGGGEAGTPEVFNAVKEQVDRLLQDTYCETSTAGINASEDSPENNISMVLTHRVKEGMFQRFEEECAALEPMIANVCHREFVSITLVRPAQGSNSYSVIMQFRNRAALQHWLNSDERRVFVDSIQELLATAAEVKLADFSTVDLLMSDYNMAAQAAPPAKWKTALIVTAAVLPYSVVSKLFIAPALADLGVGLPLIILTTATFNTFGHAYTLTPALSSIVSDWLHRSSNTLKYLEQELGGVEKAVSWLWKGLDRYALCAMFWLLCGATIGQRPITVLMS